MVGYSGRALGCGLVPCLGGRPLVGLHAFPSAGLPLLRPARGVEHRLLGVVAKQGTESYFDFQVWPSCPCGLTLSQRTAGLRVNSPPAQR